MNEYWLLIVLDVVKPIEDSRCIFPFAEFEVGDNVLVNSIKDLFANFTDFRFCGIDESAGRVIGEIGLVVFQCDKGVSFSSDVNNIYKIT